MEKENYVSLDFLRALSALIVAVGHSRFIMLVPSSEVVEISYINKFVYFVAGLGPQAVIVFFVLSGFFISKSIDKHIKGDFFSLKGYFTDRFFRLSVVAIPAILLTLCLDKIAFFFFDSGQLYFDRLDWLNSSSYNVETFLGNIFYLQTLFFNSFGSNGPLWSLAYEWWFYVLAPFLLLPLYGRRKFYMFFLVAIIIFLFSTNSKILIYFVYWFFGSVVYFISIKELGKKFNSKKLLFFFLFLVLITASLTRLRLIDKILGDGLISFSIALLIYSLVQNDVIKDNKVISFFTKISYSLYAIHLPVIIFIVSIFPYFKIKLQPTLGNSLLNLVIVSITILISYVFYLVFEKNTNTIKNKFLKYTKKTCAE